ncbi:MAG: hypothetical protein ABJC62_08635 [Frankiaceae bacterium]
MHVASVGVGGTPAVQIRVCADQGQDGVGERAYSTPGTRRQDLGDFVLPVTVSKLVENLLLTPQRCHHAPRHRDKCSDSYFGMGSNRVCGELVRMDDVDPGIAQDA